VAHFGNREVKVHCEIEFFAVGEGSKAGDAIIVRYGDVNNFKIMIVDGGTAETGEKLVAHLKKQFSPTVALEHVVLTHSDVDHASGLREVLREIPVANVWMHIPWLLAKEAKQYFKKKDWTDEALYKNIKDKYDIVAELAELAFHKSTVYYPFEGSQIGPFRVLSPDRTTYLRLMTQFDKTPDPDQQLLEGLHMWLAKASSNPLLALLEKAAAKVQKWVPESWSQERLKDGGVTSASNETSVVMYADCGNNRRILLTGDAGVNALRWAGDYASSINYPLQQFSFVQIPHHGSRRNVGPTVLNYLLGPIQPQGTVKFEAFVSAPKEDDMHPRKIVLNAFMRRGGRVIATQGEHKIYYGGFPRRAGYSDATPMSFAATVEEYD
jgi:beta-lactamase superfamily II metal-dependent hydrolase